MKTFLLTLIVIPLFAASCNSSTQLIQSCPDEWIRDEMPGVVGDNAQREYFIINGKRAELLDYDISWVEKNCKLQKQVVH